ncbi:hypothetical protein SSS_09714 [Sarcoptes scabiei]|nr:hypothetical protein SSS_09714 [Sarcoptes scabiei]
MLSSADFFSLLSSAFSLLSMMVSAAGMLSSVFILSFTSTGVFSTFESSILFEIATSSALVSAIFFFDNKKSSNRYAFTKKKVRKKFKFKQKITTREREKKKYFNRFVNSEIK